MNPTSMMHDMPHQPALATASRNESASGALSQSDLRHLYEIMVLTRAVDEKAWTLNRQGKISFVASCKGHEACQVASAMALRARSDIVFAYYRDLGVALALGMDPRSVIMSSFGKPSPINGSGRHLPWHFCDPDLKIMPSTSVVATQIPQAAGAALASKLKNEDVVTIVYFGDGATSEGDFHEGMNWAGVHQLPLVFFCENNGYAISIPVSRQMAVPSVAARAEAYGFSGLTVDGTDPVAVYEATLSAVQKARQGGGPTLIEATIHRLRPHSSDDDDRRYLSADEREALPHYDPLPIFRRRLLESGTLDESAALSIEQQAKQRVEEAAVEVEAKPDSKPDELLTHLFAEEHRNGTAPRRPGQLIPIAENSAANSEEPAGRGFFGA